MRRMSVLLSTVEAVKEFVHIANLCDFELDLISGRYQVDAKSIMGIFSLDLNNPLILELHTDDEKTISEFMPKIEKFIVQEEE